MNSRPSRMLGHSSSSPMSMRRRMTGKRRIEVRAEIDGAIEELHRRRLNPPRRAVAPARGASRRCMSNLHPSVSTWSRRPTRHTGSDWWAESIEEYVRSDGSRTLTAPLPATSKTSSGPMNAAVSSSSPSPSANGLYADRRHQPADAVALAEVLVDDDPIRESESRRQRHHVRARRGPFGSERDHVLGEEGGAGGRAGDVRTLARCASRSARPIRVPPRIVASRS